MGITGGLRYRISMESPTSTLRREPYRLLMPLGVALSWIGVGHWLFFAIGWSDAYIPPFHAMAQIQGFLLCFAVGFLFTMIPRRTQSFPPTPVELALAALCPIGTTAAAWGGHWAVAQSFFVVLCLTLVRFLIRRMHASRVRRRPPRSFVWLPVALAMGLGGAAAAGIGAAGGAELWWLHDLGQRLVLQGLFLGLILGVGGLVIPLMTRGQPPPDPPPTARDRLLRAAHLGGAILLFASFVLEGSLSLAGGFALRGAIVLVVLLLSAELWRPPSRPGWNRWLIWIAAWMVPLGYFVGAAEPSRFKAGLHVTFIGGFAMLALAVGAQVILGHTGHERVRDGRPWAVPALGLLLLAALACRVMVDVSPAELRLWLGAASGLFLSATVTWVAFLFPKILRAT